MPLALQKFLRADPFMSSPENVYRVNGHNREEPKVSTHTESDTQSKPGHGNNHPFEVTVRSLAGHSDKVTVKPDDIVGEVTDKEVKLFIRKGWLTAGDYSLSLPRVSDNELDPSATFGDLGIVEGDVLVLINRKSQVDGANVVTA